MVVYKVLFCVPETFLSKCWVFQISSIALFLSKVTTWPLGQSEVCLWWLGGNRGGFISAWKSQSCFLGPCWAPLLLSCPPGPASQKEPVKACLSSSGPIKTFECPLHQSYHIRAAGRSSRKINSSPASPPLYHLIVYCVVLPKDQMGNQTKTLSLSVFPQPVKYAPAPTWDFGWK